MFLIGMKFQRYRNKGITYHEVKFQTEYPFNPLSIISFVK